MTNGGSKLMAEPDPDRDQVHRSDLDEVFGDLMAPLFSYFLRRLESLEDAADATSETLIVLWRRRNSLPTDEIEIRKWAFGVARKVLSNASRGARRRSALTAKLVELYREDFDSSQFVDTDLGEALMRIPSADRELVLLVAWEGFSVADAGRVLGIGASAARARYSRARKRLREHLALN